LIIEKNGYDPLATTVPAPDTRAVGVLDAGGAELRFLIAATGNGI
jgi:hypothetical protein